VSGPSKGDRLEPRDTKLVQREEQGLSLKVGKSEKTSWRRGIEAGTGKID
jgi:hypothetical protein